jgi:hypothetical protein
MENARPIGSYPGQAEARITQQKFGLEGRILAGEHIRLDIAKGCLGSGTDGAVEGLDDLAP